MSDAQDRDEIREKLFRNAKQDLRSRRHDLRNLRRVANAPNISQIETYLKGVEAGLQMGENAVENLDGELMYGCECEHGGGVTVADVTVGPEDPYGFSVLNAGDRVGCLTPAAMVNAARIDNERLSELGGETHDEGGDRS